MFNIFSISNQLPDCKPTPLDIKILKESGHYDQYLKEQGYILATMVGFVCFCTGLAIAAIVIVATR